ncbi:MAG: Spy/CpxP family protein refolding chaperone [Myxococcota bacterium]
MPSIASFVRSSLLSAPLMFALAAPASAAPDDAAVASAKVKGKKKGKKNKKGKKAKKKNKAGKHARGLCAQLSCSEEQAAQISTRLQTLREGMRGDRKSAQALQTALSRELAKEKPSKKEMARIEKDLGRMQAAAHDRMFDALLDVHAVLTPEQRKTLASLVESQGLRRVFKGGRGHARPPRAATP